MNQGDYVGIKQFQVSMDICSGIQNFNTRIAGDLCNYWLIVIMILESRSRKCDYVLYQINRNIL